MRARVVAPLVAAVLGIGGGVTTALVVPGDGPGRDSPAAFEDPLHLDIPLVDQDCSGEALLVLGTGDTVAPLANAVANAGTEGTRYLRSDRSCATQLGPERRPAPAYVVYQGPFAKRSEPCAIRMSGEATGSFVTVLRAGNNTLVKCPCELPASAAPLLEEGMDVDQRDVVWIRGLQTMFNDDDPEAFPKDAVTGQYDRRTADRVEEFQGRAPAKLTEPRVADETTWGILTSQLCPNYDY